MNNIQLIALKGIPFVKPKDDLVQIILDNLKNNNITIHDNDVIVIAQKIISKSENRYVEIDNIKVSDKAIKLSRKLNKHPGLIQCVLNESKKIISINKGVLIVEHNLGFINVNAGIDLSNIPQEKNLALLLPKNPSKSANDLQKGLSEKLNKNISVIISDSMTRPYRIGVINFALASSNFQSLVNFSGKTDMYGNILKHTEIAVADELVSAAGILMGQADEKKPIIIIKGFNQKKFKVNDAINLITNDDDDLYR
tara:strand:+ start:740 stop:1501 length:762 start_codon:yes stop_codon:yes gene_type:complete